MEALLFQPCVASYVFQRFDVLTAICFYDHTRTEMHEVDDVRTNRLLAAELLPLEAVGAEMTPEQLLGVGHVSTQLFSKCALIHFPSPQPLSRKGRGA
ncbi:hypothetical protein J2X52_001488 [Luteimonas sp. 3794]|nr:hypothetical protein [Luteimonas sp. 3794]